MLAGKTVGLVGVGAIGTEVARRALAFDMRVVAFRRRSAAPALSEIELCDTLEELLAQSDHVVIAAPATPRPTTSSTPTRSPRSSPARTS